MTQYTMHVGSVTVNGAHTSVRFMYDGVNYPADHMHMVTVNTDTTIHGLVDPFDPNNVTAVVYVSSQTFAALLQDLQNGTPQTVTVTCNAQNNVTAFDWYPRMHFVAKLFEYAAQTSATVEGLNQYVRETIPEDL